MLDKISQLNTISTLLLIIGAILMILAIYLFKKADLLSYLKMKKRMPIKDDEIKLKDKKDKRIENKEIKKPVKEKPIKKKIIKKNVDEEETDLLKSNVDMHGDMQTELLPSNIDRDGDMETSYLAQDEPLTEILDLTGEEDTDILSEEEKDKLLEINKNKDEDDKIWAMPNDKFVTNKDEDVVETHADRKIN